LAQRRSRTSCANAIQTNTRNDQEVSKVYYDGTSRPAHAISRLGIDIINELEIEPDDKEDLHQAVALISPFFFPDFLESKKGQKIKDSLLFNQTERAKYPPDCRSHVSSPYVRKEFWDELESYMKKAKSPNAILDDFPMDWDKPSVPLLRTVSFPPSPHPQN
jgi:hypothetical protein